MTKCSICGQEYLNRKALKCHAKHHFTSALDCERLVVDSLYGHAEVDRVAQEYIDAKWAFYELPIDIRLYLQLMGVKRTSKEERQTPRYKEKYLKSIQAKYGEGITNISQAVAVQSKKEATAASKYGSYDAYMQQFRSSGEAARTQFQADSERKHAAWSRAQVRLMEKFGVDNPARIEHVRQILSDKAKARLSQLSAHERRELTAAGRAEMRKHLTGDKLERMVWKALIDLGFEFERNAQIGRNFSADILIPSRNLVIDIHGDFWHASPAKYKSGDYIFKNEILVDDIWARDARKQKKVTESGYSYVVLWEHELNQHKDDVVEFIKQRIDGCEQQK